MRVLLVLLIPLIVAFSTIAPGLSRAASVGEASGLDLTGQWHGSWTGTGIFHSAREDAVRVDLVQRGALGLGKLVLEGTTAAETVPEVIRLQGLNGIRVVADIKNGKVKLRHHQNGRLFTADLEVSEDGQRMSGVVRDSRPAVGIILTRAEPRAEPARPEPAPMAPPEPIQSQRDPEPVKEAVVAMVPPPAEPAAEPEKDTQAERASQGEFVAVDELKAIRFDFDKAVIRADAADALVGYAAFLKDHEDTAVLIEGHCDERGTSEYNLALGDRRAKAVKDYLALYGVTPDRLSTVSYGKERPVCVAASEACRAENRRAEFRVKTP
jgi:peptidoglycan-associated lipoprotein